MNTALHSHKLDMRAQVADAFLAKYQLRPEEARVLRGTRDGQLQEVWLFCFVLSSFIPFLWTIGGIL